MKEGWMAEKDTRARTYHYIGEDTRSLCGRYGFYAGELMEAKPGAPKGPKDCAGCYQRLQARAKAQHEAKERGR